MLVPGEQTIRLATELHPSRVEAPRTDTPSISANQIAKPSRARRSTEWSMMAGGSGVSPRIDASNVRRG